MNTRYLLAARLISTALFNLVGVSFHIIFGTIGGLIGGAIFRTDRIADKSGVQI